MSRMQSSLARHMPSGVTDREKAESLAEYERRAWLDEGIVVIRVHDQTINPAVRAIVEGYGVGKFRCKPGNGP